MDIRIMVLASVLVMLGGCTQRLTDFTVISTKNVNVPVAKGERVKGEDCADLFLGLIPTTGTFQPNLKDAIDRAIQSGKGELLIDGVVHSEVFFFPLIWTHACFTVEGTVASVK